MARMLQERARRARRTTRMKGWCTGICGEAARVRCCRRRCCCLPLQGSLWQLSRLHTLSFHLSSCTTTASAQSPIHPSEHSNPVCLILSCTVRAAGLDMLSNHFGDELLPIILPIVQQRLRDADWRARESGVLLGLALQAGLLLPPRGICKMLYYRQRCKWRPISCSLTTHTLLAAV